MEDVTANASLPLLNANMKRSRSPELKLAQLRKAGGTDDVLTDNLRAQKRYLSQAMATDIDKLNMTGPASPAHPASINHSSSMQTANDTSMRSSSMEMHDDGCQLSTPTSKRQRLSPLELPDNFAPDSRSAQLHRLSDSNHSNDSAAAQSYAVTPQAQRFKDSLDKPPVSPSDPCYGMDLRKAALLRSLMLATEGPTGALERSKASNSTLQTGRRSRRLQESRQPHPTDSASMEMDCSSNRSSMSPDTASSNHLPAPT